MKVYITGIAGMLGSNIAYLLKDKYEICGVDIIPFNAKGIKCEQFNLLDYTSLVKSIHEFAPQYLIHTAAMIDVDLCEEKKEEAYNINTKLTEILSGLCLKESCKMIYISTDAVFDGRNDRLYQEKDKTMPVNYYGETKLLGEKSVLKNGHTVIRTNIYGYNIQDKNSFGEWIYKSLESGATLNMFTDIYFSPILVNDLAEVLVCIISSYKSGLFHVCATGAVSKYEFGIYLKKVFRINKGKICAVKSDSFHFKAIRPENMGMSNKKVCKEYGITLRTAEESIEYFYELYKNNYHLVLKKWGGL